MLLVAFSRFHTRKYSSHNVRPVSKRSRQYKKIPITDFREVDLIHELVYETIQTSDDKEIGSNARQFTDLLSDLLQIENTVDLPPESQVNQVNINATDMIVKPPMKNEQYLAYQEPIERETLNKIETNSAPENAIQVEPLKMEAKQAQNSPQVDTSWLLNNPEIVVYSPVTGDILPEYFDTSVQDMTSQYEEFHDRTAAVMEERRKLLQEGCVRVRKYVKHPQNFVFWFKELRVAWCPVFKAASTNWKQFFCKIYLPELYEEFKVKTNQDPYCPLGEMLDFSLKKQILKQKETHDSSVVAEFEEGIKNSLNFLTVRHPYERLVSMYRNKFENCKAPMFSGPDGIMEKIMKMFRVGDLSLTPDQRAAQLQAARLECLKPVSQRFIDKHNPYMNPMGATFKEVVSFIVRSFQSGIWPDFHWIPVAKSCDLCIRNYEVIEKFETLERDHYYLLKNLNEEQRYPDIADFHGNPSAVSNKMTPQELVYEYFAMLDEQLIWDVYSIYKDDFTLFGYTPHFRVRSNPAKRS